MIQVIFLHFLFSVCLTSIYYLLSYILFAFPLPSSNNNRMPLTCAAPKTATTTCCCCCCCEDEEEDVLVIGDDMVAVRDPPVNAAHNCCGLFNLLPEDDDDFKFAAAVIAAARRHSARIFAANTSFRSANNATKNTLDVFYGSTGGKIRKEMNEGGEVHEHKEYYLPCKYGRFYPKNCSRSENFFQTFNKIGTNKR